MTNLDGDLMIPEGTPGNRWFEIGFEQVVMLGCPGSSFTSSGLAQGPVYARCQGGKHFLVWLRGEDA